MDPIVISPTIQEFRGVRYYLCGKYFRANGRSLHRDVWAFNNDWRGVPAGFDVHHRDHVISHNWSDNLEAIPAPEHASHHHKGHRRAPVAATEAARAWHGSEAGRDWHRRHYTETGERLHAKADFTCQQCGIGFTATVNGQNKFCSNGCKSKHRKASGVDDEQRTCMVCGNGFVANRYARKSCCSRKCAGALCVRSRGGKG